MSIIAISRQVASLGDEIARSVSEKTGYKFVTRHDLEKRIVDLGFPQEKLKKYDEKKPGFFASLVKDRDEYLNYLQTAVSYSGKPSESYFAPLCCKKRRARKTPYERI